MQKIFICLMLISSAKLTLAAPSHDVAGEVTALRSEWSADGSAIVTTLEGTDSEGAVVQVAMLGGTVGGVGMRFSHLPEVPRLHASARIRVAAATTSEGPPIWVAQAVSTDVFALAANEGEARYGIERTRNSSRRLSWSDNCVHIRYESSGTSHLTDAREFDILDAALDAWSGSAEDCGTLGLFSSLDDSAVAGPDGKNTVHFRHDSWCRPATNREPQFCYEPSAAAITRLLFVDDPARDDDGRILEVDLEFNAVYFAFTDNGETEAAPTTDKGSVNRSHVDLMSVAAHEFGHALGITHNCFTGSGTHPTDADGRLVPFCDDVLGDSSVLEATMFYNIESGETHKQTLSEADRAAVCRVAGARSCTLTSAGCSVSGTGDPYASLLALVAITLGGLRRRLFPAHCSARD